MYTHTHTCMRDKHKAAGVGKRSRQKDLRALKFEQSLDDDDSEYVPWETQPESYVDGYS